MTDEIAGSASIATQMIDGSFVANLKFWVTIGALQLIGSIGAILLSRRSAQAAEAGRLAAIERGFTSTLAQISSSKAAEHREDLRKELLLRLAAALGESLILTPRIGQRGAGAVKDFPERATRIGLEINVCRIAASPATIAATSAFMEQFARTWTALWKRSNDLNSQTVVRIRDEEHLASDVVIATMELDALLSSAQAAIRDDLGFDGRDAFLDSLNENRERIRAFFASQAG
jgi:hypothetical protein